MDKQPDEVEVRQYLRPDGRIKVAYCRVGLDLAEKAQDMILTAEVLVPFNQVSLTARWQDESEEKEITALAVNGPGKHNPANTLKDLIRRKWQERAPLTKPKKKPIMEHGVNEHAKA